MKSAPKFVQLGRTFSVLSFVLGLAVGLFLLFVGFNTIRSQKRYVRVNAMIHNKNILPSPENCNESSNRACLSMVYTYKSKDYTSRKIVQESSEYFEGKVIPIFILPQNPTVNTLDDPMYVLNIMIALFLILIGIVLFVLSFVKVVMNFKYPGIAEETGKHHLRSWL